MHAVAEQLSTLRVQLKGHFKEREDAIEASLLALVSGQHVFLLGPPGTAKTQMIRAIVKAIVQARYFEIGLSRNRPFEAVIGPLDILHWRETGEYIYRREGYATQVEIALFNEIDKMSDDLGHDLLALLNERLYHEVKINERGEKQSVWHSPLSTAFCDSNAELTSSANEDAAALWDRLLLRTTVDYVVSDSNFAAVLVGGEPEIDVAIEWPDLKDAIDNVVPAVEIPDHVQQAMVKLRHDLVPEGVKPSTRRFRQSMLVLQASAFLNGRDVATEDDIAALRFTLWDTVDQISAVDRICRSASNPFIGPLIDIRGRIHEVQSEIEKRHKTFVDAGSDWKNSEGASLQAYGKEATKKLTAVRGELETMLIEAQGRPIPGFKAVSDLQQQVFVQNFTTCLDQPRDVAEKMAADDTHSTRLGQGDGGNSL